MAHLEEGTVRTLPPQALRARLVLTVGLVDLQVLHLPRQGRMSGERNKRRRSRKRVRMRKRRRKRRVKDLICNSEM